MEGDTALHDAITKRRDDLVELLTRQTSIDIALIIPHRIWKVTQHFMTQSRSVVMILLNCWHDKLVSTSLPSSLTGYGRWLGGGWLEWCQWWLARRKLFFYFFFALTTKISERKKSKKMSFLRARPPPKKKGATSTQWHQGVYKGGLGPPLPPA